MALNLDVSKLTQSAAAKATPHDNCIVLDLGAGAFPRDIEVRLPDDDGARQNALWDGSLNLSVNDEVLCFEYSGITAWRVMAMGGNDSGAGKVRVSEIWESDFGAVALETDVNGNVTVNGTRTLTIPTDLIHAGDSDTKWSFTDDDVEITVGGLSMLKLTETAQDLITFGPGSGDVDIDFNGDMFLRGSDGLFGVGNATPTALLDVTKSFTDATKIIDVSAIAQPSATYWAVDIGPQIEPQADISFIYGSLNTLVIDNSTFDVTNRAIGCQYQVRLGGSFSGTVNEAVGLNILQPNISGGTATTTIGLRVGSHTSGGTNNRAIVSITNSGANRHNLYISGTADNYLNGDTGLGLDAPEGKLHTYDAISGFIVWEWDGLNATVRTIIPNGTGDVLYRLTAMYVLRDSAAAVASGTTDVSNGASVNLIVGGNTVRLRVNADGSADIARTGGTDTIKVGLILRWL